MTIANIYCCKRYALVAADTDSPSPGLGTIPASKIFPLYHIDSVFTLRGSSTWSATWFEFFNTSGLDFDGNVEWMRKDALYLRGKTLQTIRPIASLLPKEVFGMQELMLVGYSKKRASFAGFLLSWDHERAPIEFRDAGGDYCTPWARDWADRLAQHRPASDADRMAGLALEQVRMAREKVKSVNAFGGLLFVATLTPGEINIERVCDLTEAFRVAPRSPVAAAHELEQMSG